MLKEYVDAELELEYLDPELELVEEKLPLSQNLKAKRSPKSYIYAAICLLAVVALHLSVLFIEQEQSKMAYAIDNLENEKRNYKRVAYAINRETSVLSSPQSLSTLAAKYNMVSDNTPSFLNMKNGVINGQINNDVIKADPNIIANSLVQETISNPNTFQQFIEPQNNLNMNVLNNENVSLGTQVIPVNWSGEIPAPNTH